MFDFSDEHKQIRKVMRQYVEKEIEPHNDAMESGAITPYGPMRKLAELLGLPERARRLLEKSGQPGEGS